MASVVLASWPGEEGIAPNAGRSHLSVGSLGGSGSWTVEGRPYRTLGEKRSNRGGEAAPSGPRHVAEAHHCYMGLLHSELAQGPSPFGRFWASDPSDRISGTQWEVLRDAGRSSRVRGFSPLPVTCFVQGTRVATERASRARCGRTPPALRLPSGPSAPAAAGLRLICPVRTGQNPKQESQDARSPQPRPQWVVSDVCCSALGHLPNRAR